MLPRLGLAIALALAGLAGRAATDPILDGLRPGHPRLLVQGEAEWSQISQHAGTDPQLAAFLAANRDRARTLLDVAPAERVLTGRRLLHVSREVLGRLLVLGLAYHTTGDTAFAARAERELLAAAAFTDWNPSHFLDVGEMTAALALGYDWFHNELPPAARVSIRQALVEKGLRPGMDPAARHNGWWTSPNNWNQVCWAGLALGAIALADEEPALAAEVLTRVKEHNPRGLEPYAPVGVYPEGPNYWSYGTTYQVLLLAALESALGTRWGLDEAPGFLASAGAQLQVTAPSGRLFNFGDGREAGALQPALFWFARRLADPGLRLGQEPFLDPATPAEGAARAAFVETDRFRPLAALWWPAKHTAGTGPRLPLHWFGDGPNPVVVFRGSWSDPQAFYLAAKGGRADLSHAHMDAGSFVFEAGGVRWAIDLGLQEYESLESKGINLWNRAQDSPRWRVFRLNNLAHNTLTIDGRSHPVSGDARVVGFSAEGPVPYATIDLAPVFAGQATRALRRFEVHEGGRIVVRDSLRGLATGTPVRWAMATRAAIELAGATARLTQDGKTLQAVLAPACGARFSTRSAEPPADYDAPNPGVAFLLVETGAPASGELEIEVALELVGDAAPLNR